MTRTLKKRYGTMMFPMYNPIACHQIDNYGKEHGYAFRHAQNGGEFFIKELGYWVDGYDAKKNVVIEYYEVQHNKCRERDNRRKQEIINHLHCTFIEMWYDGKSLITS